MKVKAITLGCKVNTYESEYILSLFKSRGYSVTDDKADIYIINTCTVTNNSDSKSRKTINKIIRENKDAVIVAMGCFIQANPTYNEEGISIILGNHDKSKVVDLVEEYLKTHRQIKNISTKLDQEFEDMYIENMNSQTRAFVKIQDGCENYCSYCIIPFVRGKCRSKNKDLVLKEIKELVKNNYHEIVLTGIHTGHYGVDINTSFVDLLKEIIEIPNLDRLRISSIEITELTSEFLDLLKSTNIIVDHLHIPLQSGSDTILKLMNRKYLTKDYEEIIKKIRDIRPDISITTDLIVGFPNETDELFEETKEFIKKIKFSKIHVFPYSARKGTKASVMPNQVSSIDKKKRVIEIIKLSEELEKDYMKKFIDKELEVLIETNHDNYSIGHTGNYLQVKINKNVKPNTFIKVVPKKMEYPYLIVE
jgi:threonylcarbamoyladenosine tRNA methylthiotransferase MtaB